jgi:hypothetical protein
MKTDIDSLKNMETGFFEEYGKADSVKNMGNQILKTDRFFED